MDLPVLVFPRPRLLPEGSGAYHVSPLENLVATPYILKPCLLHMPRSQSTSLSRSLMYAVYRRWAVLHLPVVA